MQRGAAIAHHDIMYCIPRNSKTVYCYYQNQDKWQEHSQCPHSYPGLAIISEQLTAIGGKTSDKKTSKLISWKNGEWEEVFPPMNISRCDHVVVSDGLYVIAAGGVESETSVEIFTISSNTWSMVTSFPQPLYFITMTICGDFVYAMDYRGRTYSNSMSDLCLSQSEWQQLPQEAPQWRSTICTVSNAVVAVGGGSAAGSSPSIAGDIYHLCNREWVRIGSMVTPRCFPLVAVLSGDRLVVVGGVSSSCCTDAVELAVLC